MTPAVIPAQRKGPSARTPLFPLRPDNTRPAPAHPASSMPAAAATAVILTPRNRPQAAISFTSPPPNAPGTATATTRNGRLTHRLPYRQTRQREGRYKRQYDNSRTVHIRNLPSAQICKCHCCQYAKETEHGKTCAGLLIPVQAVQCSDAARPPEYPCAKRSASPAVSQGTVSRYHAECSGSRGRCRYIADQMYYQLLLDLS